MRIMKFAHKFIALLSAVALSLAMFSCDTPEPVVEDSINFLQNPLVVDKDVATYDCGLTTSGAWKATSTDQWITVLTPNGEKGEALSIRVSANKEADDRIGGVKVTVGELTATLSISQEGNSAVGFISTENLSFSSEMEKKTVTVASTSGWEITSTEGDWFTAEKENNISLAITSEVNFSGSNRTGKVVVTTGDGSRTATVNLSQVYTQDLFLASSMYGRKLVYNSQGFFKSVSADNHTVLAEGINSFTMTTSWIDVVSGTEESSPKQRKIFIFEVDLDDNTTIDVTLPYDKNENYCGTVQMMTVQTAIHQANRPDYTVWGSINGDFFLEGNLPQGTVWRDGICLKDTFHGPTCTIFAMMKDGTAACLTQSEYASRKGEIWDALGGRQQLMQNGSVIQFSACPLEPRTAIGVSQDGKKVWMLIVDGRHEKHNTGSYGATYYALARIFQSLGAYEAINLDGGGSSTYITRDNGGDFNIINIPSNTNNLERAVVNGLAIMRKK